MRDSTAGTSARGDEQQVQAENADEVEQGVEAGHDFPGFDRGDMRLRQPICAPSSRCPNPALPAHPLSVGADQQAGL